MVSAKKSKMKTAFDPKSESSFFRILFDSSLPDYTHFREPSEMQGKTVDAWNFQGLGEWKAPQLLQIAVRNEGTIYDINMGAFDLPVVNGKVKSIIQGSPIASEQVQFIDVMYGERKLYILNSLPVIDCLDEQRSDFMKWTKRDHRKDLAGTYRQVIGLHVRHEPLAGTEICRIKGWEVALIVSGQLVEQFKKAKLQGAVFQDVS
jgi:hypothetical protein